MKSSDKFKVLSGPLLAVATGLVALATLRIRRLRKPVEASASEQPSSEHLRAGYAAAPPRGMFGGLVDKG